MQKKKLERATQRKPAGKRRRFQTDPSKDAGA